MRQVSSDDEISVSLVNKYRRLLLLGVVSEAKRQEYTRKIAVYERQPRRRKGRNAAALERIESGVFSSVAPVVARAASEAVSKAFSDTLDPTVRQDSAVHEQLLPDRQPGEYADEYISLSWLAR